MIISLNLLNQLTVNYDLKKYSISEISNALMNLGIEVESVYYHSKINNLFFGQIIKCQPHPNSNKLQLCDVMLSNKKVQTIVCGAKNARKDLKVVVALEGAVLPELTIQPREILGVVSNGMICSFAELNSIEILSNSKDDSDGIIELDSDFNIYQEFDPSVIGLDDVVFDLSLPSNRPDLNGAAILCLELCAQLNCAYDLKQLEISKADLVVNSNSKQPLKIKVDKNVASVVGFLSLQNLQIKSSLWKLKRILLNNNYACINNIVDFGNYLTLLFNQPTHLHDANLIQNQEIKIQEKLNKPFKDLNGTVHQLENKDIVVLDGKDELLALGGIIGSELSAISFKTQSSYLEIINFDAIRILKTNLRLGINTSSAVSNLRAKSMYLSLLAIVYAQRLFKDYFLENETIELVALEQNQELKTNPINLDWNFQKTFIGYNFDEVSASKYLEAIGCELVKQNKSQELVPPKWRLELSNKFDIGEEIVKYVTMPKIIATAPSLLPDININNSEVDLWLETRKLWNTHGFYEAKTYNLQEKKVIEKFNFMNLQVSFDLKNPSSNLRTNLRLHALIELLKVAKFNHTNQNGYGSWYELINVQQGEKSFLTLNLISVLENNKYALNQSGLNYDLYDLKSLITKNLKLANIEVRFEKLTSNFKPLLDTFVSENTLAVINKDNNQLLGYVGQLNFFLLKDLKWDLKTPVLGVFLILEPSLEPKIANAPEISAFPSSFKDYSFLVNDSQFELQNLIDEIKLVKYVQEVKLLEKYLHENKLNYLISVRINNSNKTLVSEEINKCHEEVLNILKQKNLTVR